MKDRILSAKARTYVYSLLAPVGLLLVFYGALDPKALPLWLDVAGAALLTGSTGLSIANRPTRRRDDLSD